MREAGREFDALAADGNGIQVLAAAYLALNQGGEGSSPSGPTCTRDVTARLRALTRPGSPHGRAGSTPPGCSVREVGKLANPPVSGTGDRGFEAHPLESLRCGPMVRRLPVKETIAGSIPAAAARTEGQADGRRQPS